MELRCYLATALAAYLLGSIPTGYLLARAKGVDIRSVGSGNIGATNVLRFLGKPAAAAVLLVDILKGWLAVQVLALWIADAFVPVDSLGGARELAAIVAALFAVLGHNYTCWLKFKGGKGIATSAGVLSALVPWALLIILTVFLIVFALARYVSLASIAASATLPFATWSTTKSWPLTATTSAMSALAIYKHKANIQRLIAGTESRFDAKRKEAK